MWKDTLGQGGMGILDIINITAPLAPKVSASQWPDMDMLVVGLNGKGGPSSDLGGHGCSDIEYQTQMSMWCMLSSPLAMSNDLRKLTPEARRILLNEEVIAINQDSLGRAAERKVNTDTYQLYVRPLSGNRHAVALLNTSDALLTLTANFASLGLNKRYTIRNVWQHKTVATKARMWKGKVQPHETVVLVLTEG